MIKMCSFHKPLRRFSILQFGDEDVTVIRTSFNAVGLDGFGFAGRQKMETMERVSRDVLVDSGATVTT